MEAVYTITGKMIERAKIEEISENAYKKILSELPEEVRTYDMALYVAKEIEEKIKGSTIAL